MEQNTSTAGAQAPQYTNEQWRALLARAVSEIEALAASKGAEYSGDQDRLDNFRRGAARYGLPMEVIWGVYANKHWDSLQTYIKDLNTGRSRNYSEPIEGRVKDLLVYLLLFWAMCEERGAQGEMKTIRVNLGPHFKVEDRTLLVTDYPNHPDDGHAHNWTNSHNERRGAYKLCLKCGATS